MEVTIVMLINILDEASKNIRMMIMKRLTFKVREFKE